MKMKTKKLCAVFLVAICLSSCSHWKKIDLDVTSPKMDFFFGLYTGKQIYNVIKDGDSITIRTHLGDLNFVHRKLDPEKETAKKLMRLISQVVAKGEYVDHRPLSPNYIVNHFQLEPIAPHMSLYIHEYYTYKGKEYLNEESGKEEYHWYMYDEGMDAAGMHSLYAELNEFLYSLLPELKTIESAFPYSQNSIPHCPGKDK